MNGKRVDIQIIGDILRLREAGKTEIALAANLGHRQLERYLGLLMHRGFLEEDTGRRVPVYRVTPKGQELLKRIDRVTQPLGFAELDAEQ